MQDYRRSQDLELLPFDSGYRRGHGTGPGLGRPIFVGLRKPGQEPLPCGIADHFCQLQNHSSEVQRLPLLGDPSNLSVSHNKGQNYALSLMHCSCSVGQPSSTSILEAARIKNGISRARLSTSKAYPCCFMLCDLGCFAYPS